MPRRAGGDIVAGNHVLQWQQAGRVRCYDDSSIQVSDITEASGNVDAGFHCCGGGQIAVGWRGTTASGSCQRREAA